MQRSMPTWLAEKFGVYRIRRVGPAQRHFIPSTPPGSLNLPAGPLSRFCDQRGDLVGAGIFVTLQSCKVPIECTSPHALGAFKAMS